MMFIMIMMTTMMMMGASASLCEAFKASGMQDLYSTPINFTTPPKIIVILMMMFMTMIMMIVMILMILSLTSTSQHCQDNDEFDDVYVNQKRLL